MFNKWRFTLTHIFTSFRLFTDHGYQPLFSNLAQYEITGLEGSPELNTHARNVMAQLDTLVGSLQNSIELGQSLAQLGKDHVPRKVNRVHFKVYFRSNWNLRLKSNSIIFVIYIFQSFIVSWNEVNLKFGWCDVFHASQRLHLIFNLTNLT